MTKTLVKFLSLLTLGAFALVLSGVLFCSVTPAGMAGMQGMDATHCPAALQFHFDTIQILTGSPAGFVMILALVAFASAATAAAVSLFQEVRRLTRPRDAPAVPYWLSECFRRGILNPKIFPIS